MKHHLCVIVLGTAVALVFWIGASDGVVTKYVEDFTTTQYKDPLNTTADWNTAAGELRLFQLPLLSGRYDTPGDADGVAVAGDHAFVADRSSGLQVIDITNPAAPTLAGAYNTSGSALAVAVAGDHAFVADGSSGLQVIDISNLTAPTLVGTYNTPSDAVGIAVAGDHAFVADGSSGLQVINISNPSGPTLVGTYNTPGSARGVCVSGDHVYVADFGSGLRVIDISNPAAPTEVGSYNTPGTAYDVTVAGDHAYVADWISGLQVIDISNPAAPTVTGNYDAPGLSVHEVCVSGDHAYLVDWTSGLQVIDITNPPAPTLAATCNTTGEPLGLCVAGVYAFMADGFAGLQVIDISKPLVPPVRVGVYDTPDHAEDVYISGDHAYVADNDFGLRVIDITNPAAPTLAGEYETPGAGTGVTVSGDHAFLADQSGGLQVIDCSDPTYPTLAGFYDETLVIATDVHVSGDHAFVADGSGHQVIDITDPAVPTLVGWYDPAWSNGVTVSGDHAFVGIGQDGLRVVDITEPADPWPLGTCDTQGIARRVGVSGDHAFVADSDYGLQVIDVTDPTAPMPLGDYDTPGYARDVAIAGDHAFVTDGTFGLQVIDISDPMIPTLVGSYDTPDYAVGVCVSGERAFVADGQAGLQVIQVFQSDLDTDHNLGRSLVVDASNGTIVRTRLTTTQTNNVTWELSADDGVSWQGIGPNGSWNKLTVPGNDLVWRSTHTLTAPGAANPSVTQLEIDWRFEEALIDSIVDVSDDQGGWVYLYFTRSGYDFADEGSLPISDYGIWRRVDDAALVAALNAASSAEEKSVASDTPASSVMPVITYGGGTYVQSRPGLAAPPFPPGTWALVLSVPAVQQDAYVAAVPTAADSSASGPNHTVLVITAHTTTPSIWYISEVDSGYSVDNIAPGVPQGFSVTYNTGNGNTLSWDPSEAADFQYFRVYRSTDPNFVPSPAELVHLTIGTSWADPDHDGWNVYYKITACDHAGNESDPAWDGAPTDVAHPMVPKRLALYQNHPNPFNPVTTIRFDLPEEAQVRLDVYSARGALIRNLVSQSLSAQSHHFRWDGKDSRGNQVSSGVYFYRLTAGNRTLTKKMVLLK